VKIDLLGLEPKKCTNPGGDIVDRKLTDPFDRPEVFANATVEFVKRAALFHWQGLEEIFSLLQHDSRNPALVRMSLSILGNRQRSEFNCAL
jgi:hypothetical protein